MRNPVESYILTNTKGEFKIWIPAGNQTFSDVSMDYSSFGDLVYLSMCGRLDDLGLLALGYKLQTTVREEGYLKKTFVTAGSGKAAKVLLVLKDYLPIYCEYISDKGAVLNRTYYSDYRNFARIMMPCRITAVDYGTKKDSTVTRTIYSNVQVDVDDPAFGFEVPADAKPAKLDLSKRK